ncbi:hypothetical protein MTR_3g006610 [Medicago truncatula]|uniref:Uncharacterized protein n=1 Tax=Medicago truncatula TaxID=3880 RepID=A0A072USL9_MEDTR|nr:hypothetical protein MTR_3g006610 [Medicago truncatula]
MQRTTCIICQPINGATHKDSRHRTGARIWEVLDPPPRIGTQSINTNSIFVDLKKRNSNNLIITITSGMNMSKAKSGSGMNKMGKRIESPNGTLSFHHHQIVECEEKCDSWKEERIMEKENERNRKGKEKRRKKKK